MEKTYYQCTLVQRSPLRIGTGFGDATDSDVMKDSRGLPFIPGTSLAGVLRSYYTSEREKEQAKVLFGDVEGAEQTQSKVLVSDAVMTKAVRNGADYRISPRDGVGLNDRGVTERGAKFDFEVVECAEGTEYTAVIELSESAGEPDREALERVLREIQRDGVSFGARTTRGYGRMEAQLVRRTFSLTTDLDDWLAFDPFDKTAFGGEPLAEGDTADKDDLVILMKLSFPGSYSVRKYTSALPKPGQNAAPDYSPLSNIENEPVIPGTSWAGSFRHHMRDLIRETTTPGNGRNAKLQELDALFGKCEKKRKSLIRFSETAVKDAAAYQVTRVAVDRFTAAPRNQGLFTSEVAWGGTGELEIKLPAGTNPELLRLLAAAINDLHLGLMTVGGEANVGRGICRITELTVNGEDYTKAVTEACRVDYLEGGDKQ